MGSYPFEWTLEADRLERKVRLSIFTITGVCAGLPTLVWSVSDLIHHRKNGLRISIFIILLLLIDFVELFLSPYVLIKELIDEFPSFMDWTFRVLWSLWGMSRACGLFLNQLVALEGILSVKYPLYTASALSPCYITLCILMIICIIIGQVFLHSVYYFFLAVLVLIVSVITWILFYCVSCCADHHSHTFRKPDHHILVVLIFTLLVIYLPYTVFSFFIYFYPFCGLFPVLSIPSFLMSMRLIIDPLLCVLVFRQSLRIQTSQNPEEASLRRSGRMGWL